jgi:hypothetical protein
LEQAPSDRTTIPGRVERAALAFVVAVIAWVGLRLCSGPEETLAFLFYDDAYYYFGVSRNLAAGLGSTFDGINPTNGYHPLWCWILIPVFRLVRDPGTAVRVIGVLWFTLAALAPLALWKALRLRTGGAGAVMAAALFGLQPVLGMGLSRPNALETPLYALLIAASIGLFERTASRGSPSPMSMASLGAVLGLTTLARFDGGFLGIAVVALLTWNGIRDRRSWIGAGRIAVLIGTATLIVAPSLVWNTARFDHPVPVSGRVVSLSAEHERAELGGVLSFDNVRRRAGYAVARVPSLVASGAFEDTAMESVARRTGTLGGFLAMLFAVATVIAALAQRRRAGPPGSDALVALATFAALHYAIHVAWLWSGGEARYRLYYYTPEAMLLAAAAGAAVGPWLGRLRRPIVRRALGATGLAFLGWHLGTSAAAMRALYAAEPGPVAERYIYPWVRERLPPDAILGARDAGKLGYFSGRPVVNLDGLINDQRLFAALRTETVAEYICRSPIDYLFYDRPVLGGYDPSSPDTPPPPEADLGRDLYRLHNLPECSIREIPKSTDDWVVVNVLRGR